MTTGLPRPLCGCWYKAQPPHHGQHHLPMQSVRAHAKIQDVISHTTLNQTFQNDTSNLINDTFYSFPLYDGVSVVSFKAIIGGREIRGLVKEKSEARRQYQVAIERGSSAALLEQREEASDVFTAHIGNVGAGEKVDIEVVFIGELKHDAEANGIRFTIPTSVAPRYGTTQGMISSATARDGMHLTVDVQSPEGCPIQQIQSPSHPVDVTIGRTAWMSTDAFSPNQASAVLSLSQTSLDKDFVVIFSIKDSDKPRAFLETHSSLPDQRALMATLVPKFKLEPAYGEIVFIVDRSGSMDGKMDMVINAMTILLKSLPIGVKFNVCSFGSHHRFMWPQSQDYNDSTLSTALAHLKAFKADFGGTEMLKPVQAAFSQSLNNLPLDVILLTDGEIWAQAPLLDAVRQHAEQHHSRFFCLGIGSNASTALVEGISAAGDGFCQFVGADENMDKKMVRLLKGALSPRIKDLRLDVRFKEDDYEMVEAQSNAVAASTPSTLEGDSTEPLAKPTMSFFDETSVDYTDAAPSSRPFADYIPLLPDIPEPSILHAPATLPPLYSFSRTTAYVLLDPSTHDKTPEAVILKGTTPQGNLELEIKVEDIGPGETLHQLAAKKAVQELENGRGWLYGATDETDSSLLREKHAGRWGEILKREGVRLGVKYQVASKWCSFIAVDSNGDERETLSNPTPAVLDFAGTCFRGRTSAAVAQAQSTYSSRTRQSMAIQPRCGTVRFCRSRDDDDDDDDDDTISLNSIQHFSVRPVAHRRVMRATNTNNNYEANQNDLAYSRWRADGHIEASRNNMRPNLSYAQSRLAAPRINRTPFQPLISTTRTDKMQALVALQSSNGSWEWHQEFVETLGVQVDKIPLDKWNTVMATILAVAFLQSRAASAADSYELLVDKARSWLRQQPGVDVEKEISDALQYLEPREGEVGSSGL